MHHFCISVCFMLQLTPIAANQKVSAVQNKSANCDDSYNSTRRLLNVILEGYDKNGIPHMNGVTVTMELIVQAISHLSEVSGSFTADVLFSQVWQDERLRYAHMAPCLQNLSLSFQMIDELWVPHVCFVNSKKTEIHASPTPNIFLMIYPNGTVWTNYRVKIEAPCNMDLALFPMDVQKCEIVLESYAYNRAKVRLNWRAWHPVFSISKSKLPSFVLQRLAWGKAQFEYPAGLWDHLTVSFYFSRSYGFYILQGMFLPIYITVFVSWIAFWLDRKALPARMTLGVSALMSLTFQYGNVARSLPHGSYVKAIDVWLFACIGFIFASLVELAVVGFVDRVVFKRQAARQTAENGEAPGSIPDRFKSFDQSPVLDGLRKRGAGTRQASNERFIMLAMMNMMTAGTVDDSSFAYPDHRPRFTGRNVDQISQKLFPTLFMLFNIVYWIYYVKHHFMALSYD